jgi:uncharacterized damage-inducible protein DinB
MSHVVESGYGYANRARDALSLASQNQQVHLLSRSESLNQLALMLAYTSETMDGRWHYSDDEISAVRIRSQWGPENPEQLFEHAIVHALRHRRQVQRFLG